MDFTGVIVEIKEFPIDRPSVRVRAHHDRRILEWAEWQSDLSGEPTVGRTVRITVSGPIKIAY